MAQDSPFQTPEAQDTPPPTERLDLDSLRTRAMVATVSVLATGGLGLLLTVLDALGFAESEDDSMLYLAVGAGLGLAAVSGIISFLVWLRRAASNVRALRPEAGFTYTLGWTIGWWFVPFLNLWRPFQVVHEIWHRSEHATQGAPHQDWGKNPPTFLSAWWAAWITGNMLERVASRHEGIVIETIAALVSLVGAVLCVQVIQRIGQAQVSAAREAGL